MSSQVLDKKLDLSLDDLIKQAAQARRPAPRAGSAKPTAAPSQKGLAPKLLGRASGGRAPVIVGTGAKTGIAGKRQVIRSKRQAPLSTAAVPVFAAQQQRTPRVLQLKASDLKRRGTVVAPISNAAANVRRNLARRIVNKALAPKVVAAAPRQRGASQRAQPVAAAGQRGRPVQQLQQQQQLSQRQQRQQRQQITYAQPPVPLRPQQLAQQVASQRQAPVSVARRMRLQRQQQQAAQQQQRAQQAGRRPQQVQQAPQQQVVVRRGGQQLQQQQQQHVRRVVPAPRQQQQRQMLGRVQQGGVRKNRALQQPAQRRAPVFAGAGNVNASGNQKAGNRRGGRPPPAAAVQRQQQQQRQSQARGNNVRGGGRNQQQAAPRQRAPIMAAQQAQGNWGARGSGARNRRGRR